MIVYDPEGNEHEKPGVDARECVEHLGWTWAAEPKAAAIPVEEVKASTGPLPEPQKKPGRFKKAK